MGVAATLGGLRTVLEVGRAGGLLKDPLPAALAADVVVGRVLLDSLGAVGLVSGFVDGCVLLVFVSSPALLREVVCLSMFKFVQVVNTEAESA